MERLEAPYITDGDVSGTVVENNRVAPQEVTHTVSVQLSNPTPRYKSKTTENICPCKDWYTNTHGSVIHVSQKVRTAQMSVHQLMDGEARCGISIVTRRSEVSCTHCNMNEPCEYGAE